MKNSKVRYFTFIVISLAILKPLEVSAKDFLVAIDLGHSAHQPGAVSSRGIGEFFFNKRIGERLHSKITAQKSFIKSFIINGEDGDISLLGRANVASKRKADLLVSIHHDSVQPEFISYWHYNGKKQHFCDLYKGFSLFYSELNADPHNSLLFAILLGSEMVKNKLTPSLHHVPYMKGENKGLVDPDRGIYKYNNLKILKTATIAAVLIECGIIVNREEEVELCKPEYQDRVVNAIMEAIRKYVQI